MKLLIQIIFLLLICISLKAQNAFDEKYSISGEINFDFTQNEPTIGVHEVVLSDEDGNELNRVVATPQYEFTELEAGENYIITVESEVGLENGMTTYDIVIISSHVRALNFLVYPYQLIAGDINRNNSVSLSDMIMAEQMILNLPTAVEYIGWRYIPADFNFPPSTNPSEIPEFPEAIMVNNMSKNIKGQNFTAIRVGGVN